MLYGSAVPFLSMTIVPSRWVKTEEVAFFAWWTGSGGGIRCSGSLLGPCEGRAWAVGLDRGVVVVVVAGCWLCCCSSWAVRVVI